MTALERAKHKLAELRAKRNEEILRIRAEYNPQVNELAHELRAAANKARVKEWRTKYPKERAS